MATGASVADLALLLVSAEDGATRQTKRHLVILSMLGIQQVVLVVNKMDCVGWSEAAFRSIEEECREFAASLGINDVAAVPVAAKSGDNVVDRSRHMAWYRGQTVLEYLEQVEPDRARGQQSFRMPVQWVSRPNPEFRGYSGMVAGGEARPGMSVKILPSGRATRVERIATFDGDLPRAVAGRSVTLTFTDQIDASRGDIVIGAGRAPATTDQISARLFWMNDDPLRPGHNYIFKLATTTVTAHVEPQLSVFDLDSRRLVGAGAIGQNEIGFGTLTLDRPIAVDRYVDCKDTGSFILIDPESYDTVGMGCVEDTFAPRRLAKTVPRPANSSGNKLSRWTETHARSLAKAASWRATGSLDTFVIAFVVTGSPKVAGSVAVTEVLTKILIYYCHERVWSWVPWGKQSRS